MTTEEKARRYDLVEQKAYALRASSFIDVATEWRAAVPDMIRFAKDIWSIVTRTE